MFSFLNVTPTHFGASEVIFDVPTYTAFQLEGSEKVVHELFLSNGKEMRQLKCLFLASNF